VAARYAVTGFNNLRALALDPLVADCTGRNCATSAPLPMVSKFWLGDFGSGHFLVVNFNSTGAFTPYDANQVCPSPPCSITSIESVVIYGGEGSNQPDLTKLFTGVISPPTPANPNSNTASVQFPLPVTAANTNMFTVSGYTLPAGNTGLNLYGSLVNLGSCFSDASPGLPSLPCEPTTSDLTKAIVWKTDIPTGTTVPLPSTAYLAEKFAGPHGVDFSTDAFTDVFYDTTVSSGNFDPVSGNKGSVETLIERATRFSQGQSGCFYESPTENSCYKTNRGTLNFIFQCPGLTQPQFLNLQNKPGPPTVSLVETFPTQTPIPAPQIIVLNGTNAKAPYRYDSSGNDYTFQWNLSGAESSGQLSKTKNSTLRGCTYDPTNTVQTFCVDFTTSPTCK